MGEYGSQDTYMTVQERELDVTSEYLVELVLVGLRRGSVPILL